MTMLKIGCILSVVICVGHAFMCPDGKSQCDEGTTCCLISATEYGCCPLPKAVCCKDKIHCCPHKYLCDLSTSSCFQGNKDGMNSKVAMLLKQPARMIQTPTKKVSSIDNPHTSDIFTVGNVMCPDRYSICPTGTTCCLLDCGRYGCCQYSEGVCCDDHIHCCPHNYKCNIPYCSPQQQYIELPMKTIHENNDNGSFLSVIYHTCPDEKSRCGHGKKCCPAQNGKGYNCCGYHLGECCSDALHCCPRGFTCDLVNKKCRKKLKNIPMSVKLKAKSIKTFAIPHLNKQLESNPLKHLNKVAPEILCPDNKTKCHDNNTCCNNVIGATFCCPFAKAICCEKTSHCCPKGYKCEPGGAGLCNKIPAPHTIKGKLYDVTCPDGISKCPDNNTCCIVKTGGYGCCPIPNAVCCKDKKHCCPTGYKCNDGQDYCVKGSHKIKQTKAFIIVDKKVAQLKLSKGLEKTITCPDGSSKCEYGSTCCQISDDGYGCCPLLKAICCEDKKHCCPHKFKCTKGGYCSREGETVLASTYTKTLSVQVTSKFKCPDEQSTCFQGETCCPLKDGFYGCCPLKHAVCCKDEEHCCPRGYRCDGGFCTRGLETLLASSRTLSLQNVSVVKCPDGVSSCPDGNTCCKLSNEEYGCCPLPDAVCCSDHQHCCPHGYTCSSGGFCSRGSERILAVKHLKAVVEKNVICPDGLSKCKKGSTCCKLATSGYGCCPLDHAVCCSDKLHCCPKGFKCTKEGYCMSGALKIAALKHSNAVVTKNVDNIICSDGRTVCTHGTCCRVNDDTYKCCGLLNAVCCADQIHCCPSNYKCIQGGSCKKGSNLHLALKNVDAVVFPMIIPKKHKIHEDRLSTPSKFEVFRLTRERTRSLNDRDKFLLSILRHELKVCGDGFRRCQQYETCCPSNQGYICCPFYNAVCCEDRCCPHDSNCSNEGSCERFPGPNEPIKFKP